MEDGSVPKQNNVNDFKWLWDPSVTHISKNHYSHTERQQQQKLMREKKAYCENMADGEAINLETPPLYLCIMI